MSQVGIDLMRLCETDGYENEAGYNYVITAQCHFTKYVEIGALKNKTGLEVGTWIYMNIFCRYGVTDIHISDRGKEFCNEVSKELYKKCGVRHRITTPYHLQANGMIECCNRTSELILKMISSENKQRDWVNYLPTVAFTIQSSMHHVTNYEPLMFLIGHKPKLPVECTQYEEDVLQSPDFIAEEVEMLSQHITEDTFQNMVKMRDSVFQTAEENIKKGQKRQKKNYDLRNARLFQIAIGDIVLKEKQKDISRKGGKLHDRYNYSTYTVINIRPNGNATLQSNKSKEILSTPCPVKHLKKYVTRNENSPTATPVNDPNAATIPSVTNSNQNNYESDATQITSATTSTDTENVPSKKKLVFEDDLTTSAMTAVINTSTPNKEHLQFVDNILDITVEGEDFGSDMEMTEILDSDDEFSMETWSETKVLNWPFNPLTESSHQTVGPLVQVTRFGDYPKYVLGWDVYTRKTSTF